VSVDADFALADDAVETTSRHAGEAPLEVVVEALASLLFGDLEMLHARAAFARNLRWRGGGYVRHCFYNGLSSII
jgi:hypothetical protein